MKFGISRALILLLLSHLVCVRALFLQDEEANNTTNVTHNGTKKPRVFVVVVQTHATQGWCRLILSAKLSNVEIVTIAMGGLYSHVKRPRWVLKFLEKQNASDEDIVIHLDGSDIIVSDREKYENAVEYFMQNTAENEEKFSGEDIVKEKHISPIMFMTTSECYAPQLDLLMNSDHKEHVQRCYWFFNVGYRKEEDKKLPHLLKSPPSGKPYLSGGGLIARVWAFKKFEYAFGELLKGSEEWWSEQSIYKPLLIWSAIQEEAVGQRFVLKRGMIGLDYEEIFFTIPSSGVIGEAPFIHFPGQPIAWEEKARLIVKNLSWYKELKGSEFNSKDMGKVETYLVGGENWDFRYETICGDAVKENDLFKAKKL
uniref:Variable surface glycoprotein n=1 Tax=Trypanosoma brucei TaxID=5691 RepID=Q26748_9TRYP|nr:variable surface glycoprotein [Trypanosoma brucei brucei]